MRSERRPTAFLLAALVIVAGAMTLVVREQRNVAVSAADRREQVGGLVAATFDVDAAARGYLLSGRPRDLGPLLAQQGRARRVLRATRATIGTDPALRPGVERAASALSSYERLLGVRLAEVARSGPEPVDIPNGQARTAALQRFRAAADTVLGRLDRQRDADLRAAGRRATAVIVLIVLLLGIAGYLLIRRGTRLREAAIAGELRYRERQREFTDVIQAVASEHEAHAVLKRHVERLVDGAVVTVLTRNASDNRLDPATPVPSDSPLTGGLRGAEPRDCVAVRLAQPHGDGADADADSLVTCRICGMVPGRSDCRPLLVGGRVIGSVLVEHPEPLAPDEQRAFAESVGRAAPVLSNLRTIAIAESRAATDPLTGLANRRAMNDTLKQMAAQASRSVQPLSAIAMDLDHFKQINDRYGHDAGDSVLAAVGDILRTTTRESDLAGRVGGEEFIVLAPDTGVEGAEILAEKLRSAIERAEIPGIDESITASFGIAVLPDDAHTADLLLRRADRALYVAKELGRNRVELIRAFPD